MRLVLLRAMRPRAAGICVVSGVVVTFFGRIVRWCAARAAVLFVFSGGVVHCCVLCRFLWYCVVTWCALLFGVAMCCLALWCVFSRPFAPPTALGVVRGPMSCSVVPYVVRCVWCFGLLCYAGLLASCSSQWCCAVLFCCVAMLCLPPPPPLAAALGVVWGLVSCRAVC